MSPLLVDSPAAGGRHLTTLNKNRHDLLDRRLPKEPPVVWVKQISCVSQSRQVQAGQIRIAKLLPEAEQTKLCLQDAGGTEILPGVQETRIHYQLRNPSNSPV